MAKYHKDIDTVVIQFMNTTDFEGYQWNLLQLHIVVFLKSYAEQPVYKKIVRTTFRLILI